MEDEELLKAMAKEWEEAEYEFEFTKVLYELQMICSIHGVGEKNIQLLRYVCPSCKSPLDKRLKKL